MRKITQEEYDNFPVDADGIKQCPTGDYSEITSFGKRSSFGKGSSFGEWCSFGKGCSFGEVSSFGERSSFGEGCSFGKWCSFGEWCSFGKGSSFGEGCSFGEWCSFGEMSKIEGGHPLIEYVGLDRIGSAKRKTYFFKCTDGNFVRCGCFFGTFDEFAEKVKKEYPTEKHGRDYIAGLEYAKLVLEIK